MKKFILVLFASFFLSSICYADFYSEEDAFDFICVATDEGRNFSNYHNDYFYDTTDLADLAFQLELAIENNLLSPQEELDANMALYDAYYYMMDMYNSLDSAVLEEINAGDYLTISSDFFVNEEYDNAVMSADISFQMYSNASNYMNDYVTHYYGYYSSVEALNNILNQP